MQCKALSVSVLYLVAVLGSIPPGDGRRRSLGHLSNSLSNITPLLPFDTNNPPLSGETNQQNSDSCINAGGANLNLPLPASILGSGDLGTPSNVNGGRSGQCVRLLPLPKVTISKTFKSPHIKPRLSRRNPILTPEENTNVITKEMLNKAIGSFLKATTEVEFGNQAYNSIAKTFKAKSDVVNKLKSYGVGSLITMHRNAVKYELTVGDLLSIVGMVVYHSASFEKLFLAANKRLPMTPLKLLPVCVYTAEFVKQTNRAGMDIGELIKASIDDEKTFNDNNGCGSFRRYIESDEHATRLEMAGTVISDFLDNFPEIFIFTSS
ncbi:hypothetical protein PAEPH01_1526 [Pancytospora epiphaga]|nr:hypothetical protein PAEPH01_1526 [Pancytospora epiphaga]